MNAKVSVGSVPAEANSGATLNETTTGKDRSPDSDAPVTDGPRYVPETQTYLPAQYEVLPGIVRRDR